MTGNEMIKRALTLLGYTDSMGNVSGEQRFKSRALEILNTIYADLFYINNSSGFTPLKSVSDNIILPERVLYDVMPYGVAANLAQSESDGDNQQYFMMLYNAKRVSVGSGAVVQDVIPCP